MPRRSAAVLIVLMLAACAGPTDEVELPPPTTPEASIALVEPSYQLTPMPIALTWQPDDSVRYVFKDAQWNEYLAGRAVDEWQLQYDTARLTLEINRDLTSHELLVTDAASPPTPVTMLGAPAEMRTSGYGHSDFWVWSLTDPDGTSVVVSGTDAEVVERFARGLRREPQEIVAPFAVELLPEGFVPVIVASHAMEFVSSRDCCGNDYVAIALVEPDPSHDPTGTPTTVGGHPAEVVVGEIDIAVHIERPDGSELRVSASSGIGLDEAALLRIAEGVRVTDAAVPLRAPGSP